MNWMVCSEECCTERRIDRCSGQCAMVRSSSHLSWSPVVCDTGRRRLGVADGLSTSPCPLEGRRGLAVGPSDKEQVRWRWQGAIALQGWRGHRLSPALMVRDQGLGRNRRRVVFELSETQCGARLLISSNSS
jgi:hypothetical protein